MTATVQSQVQACLEHGKKNLERNHKERIFEDFLDRILTYIDHELPSEDFLMRLLGFTLAAGEIITEKDFVAEVDKYKLQLN